MKGHPLLALALGWAAGATLVVEGTPLVALAAGALLSLSPVLAPLGFLCAGAVAASAIRVTPAGTGWTEERLEGRVASVPERLEDRARFALRLRDGRLVLASAPALPYPLAPGDRVRLEARLRAPEGERNPGGRDRARDLAARGIALEAFALAPPVRVAPPSPLAALEAGRTRFAEAAAASLPPREAGLVRAIGAGDRSGVDAATQEAFARSGLAHLLSVSGLHLAVVALGAWRLLRAVLTRWEALAARVDPRRAAAALALPLAAGYAVATGADVPVVRSALAAALSFGGVLLDREGDSLDGVALAALAVLAVEPGALRDPSFQLSFASVAALALGTRPLREAIPLPPGRGALGRAREALLGAACASAAATLATAPIVAFHFRRLSLVAVLSNLVGVPLGSALTVLATLAGLASALAPPALAAPLLWACRPLAWLLLTVNDAFAAPSVATVGVGSPGLPGVAACLAALLALRALRGRRRALAALAAAAALLLPPPLRHALARRRGGLEVTFLAVGQGDAAALLLPDGSTVLVDGGGDAGGHYDPGLRDVVPWLRDTGVTRIAAVFVSHPHPDHLFGLAAVAASLPIERLFGNGRTGDDAAAAVLARLPRMTTLRPGDVFERAGVRFEALAPPPGSEAWSENDASLVLRITHGEVRFLLCGDVEREGEPALLAARPGPVDVVKIPHHGSATSSGPALVAATRPRLAVATVGRDNRFGFPDAEVVERWRRSGARVLRTDEGAVRLLSDGRRVRLAPAAAAVDLLALARERP